MRVRESEPVAVELCAGTGSFARAWEELGGVCYTVDVDSSHDVDLVADITDMRYSDIPEKFRTGLTMVWFSSPCTCFSVASIGHHWKGGVPSAGAVCGNDVLMAGLRLINVLRPEYWAVENPRGMMRKLPIMAALPRKTVTYCQYGDNRMKPTDIWTNIDHWTPKPPCKNGDSCHESAPRGSRTGTQGLDGSVSRSRIPHALMLEVARAAMGERTAHQEVLV